MAFNTTTRKPTSYGDPGFSAFLRGAFQKGQGYTDEDLEKPVVGICNTWSELNHCHQHLRTLAEAVKRGVWQAGGFPLEFPVMSLGEYNMRPTTMLYRNLMSVTTPPPEGGGFVRNACVDHHYVRPNRLSPSPKIS